jgi:hypothetical protein
LKRGRGSQKKSKVLVMAESVPFKQEDGKKNERQASQSEPYQNDCYRQFTEKKH